MDYKDFHDGMLSLSLVLSLFSLSFLIGSIALKPYIGLELNELILIVILCVTNLAFNTYYAIEALRLKEVFKLADSYVIKFGKRFSWKTISAKACFKHSVKCFSASFFACFSHKFFDKKNQASN